MARNYTPIFKVEVLDHYHQLGNAAQTARDKDVSRDALYKWLHKEEEIRQEAEEMVERQGENLEKRKDLVSRYNKQKAEYENLELDGTGQELAALGDRKARKVKMGQQVEALLFRILNLLDDFDELKDVHPKDKMQMAERAHKIKQDLYEEPGFIIEIRNRYIRDSLSVLRDMDIPKEKVEAFAEEMAKIEQAEMAEVVE